MRIPTLENAKKRAWTAFSAYIRARDKRCISCNTGLAENGGHYWHNVLDFDEENINGQCVRCNKWLSGNLASYGAYLLKKLGLKKFNDLDKRHTLAIAGEKRSIEDYLEIEARYRVLLKKLTDKSY